MTRFHLLLIIFLSSLFAQIEVSLSKGWVEELNEVSVSVELSNQVAIAGFQFKLRDAPNFLSAVDYIPSSRLSGFTIVSNEQDDGSEIVAAFNLNGGVIQPGFGPIMDITFMADTVFTQTEISLSFSDVIFGAANSHEIPSIFENGVVTIVPESGVLLEPQMVFLSSHDDNTMELFMTNELPVAGFQFHIELGPDLTTIEGVNSTDRTTGWAISEGWNNVVGFSMAGDVIEPGDGSIMTFSLAPGDDWGEGRICLTEIIISDVNGELLPARSSCSFIGSGDGVIGDVNADFEVNILDIVQIVGIIMGNEFTPYEFWASDINSDADINVLDIVQIVSIIMEA